MANHEMLPGPILTRREREVCDLIVLGLTGKEAAAQLGMSPRTVEDHRAQIYKKYGVHNTVLLVRKVYHIEELMA